MKKKRNVSYSGETITVYAKGTGKELTNGAYLWKVKAFDNAGNTKDSEERTLLINTRQAIFSNPSTFFPLTLLNIGGTNINFSSLDSSSLPQSFKINNFQPTFYGISFVNSKVTLTIKRLKEIKGDLEENRGTLKETYGESEEIFKGETITNQESRFGINLSSSLTPGDYQVNLSASLNNDYVELPEFTLTIGSGYTTVAGSSIFIDSGSGAGMTKENDQTGSFEHTQDDLSPTPQPKDSTLSPTGSFAPLEMTEKEDGMTETVNLFQKILQFLKKIFSAK